MPAREGLIEVYAAQELEMTSQTTAVDNPPASPPQDNLNPDLQMRAAEATDMRNVIRDLVESAEQLRQRIVVLEETEPDPRDRNLRVLAVWIDGLEYGEDGEPIQNGSGVDAGVEPSQNEARVEPSQDGAGVAAPQDEAGIERSHDGAGVGPLPEEASDQPSDESFSAWDPDNGTSGEHSSPADQADQNNESEEAEVQASTDAKTLVEQQDVNGVPEDNGKGPSTPTPRPNASARHDTDGDTLIEPNTPKRPENNDPVRYPLFRDTSCLYGMTDF
jgi:Fe-S-cluster formation regulator IscX/YfhJ